MILYCACTIFFLVTCDCLPHDRNYAHNVGTVLFSASDIKKKQWTKNEIGLLQARRYFQNLLPPPIFINTFNEDHVNILLRYFKDAYAAIKKEANDPETDTILTTALSDAIGGYLKVWVLPVAKLDYYGGTISQSNVVKLFQFYNEIKRYLDTNGDGWRKPDKKILNSMTINVAPLQLLSNTRSMKDPCDHLAYFEKTPTGLSIPIPNVSWNDKSSTMFVPLKNLSLILMNSPGTSHNLIKYYDAARSCIQTSNPKQQENFDERFQKWLIDDVVPHLKDENLYLALGSVLSLVNRTRDLCNSVLDLYVTKYNMNYRPKKIPSINIPYDISCKKMWIITIILLIEIAWCVPAILFVFCSKKFQKKDCSSNVYLFIDNDKKDKGEAKTNYCEDTCSACLENTPCGTQILRKTVYSNMKFTGPCPPSQKTTTVETGTVPSRKLLPRTCLDRVCATIETKTPETCEITKKSSLKKTYSIPFCNSTQISALSSHENFGSKPSGASCLTSRSRCFPSVVDVPSRSKKRREKDECKRHEDRKRSDDCFRKPNERKQSEDCIKLEERRQAEEYRKLQERRQAEEFRKVEERRHAEESRKLEERRQAEECRKLEERRQAEEFRQLEERRQAEECKKLEERRQADECRKLEERRQAEEFRKLEEWRQTEECRNLEERRKAEDCRKLEERRQAEECRQPEKPRQSEECRKIEERRPSECRKLEERSQAEKCKKLEERRLAVECRKLEERRQSEECRKLEERSQAEECRKLEERRMLEEFRKHRQLNECRKSDDSRKFDGLRKYDELRKLDELRQLDEHRKLDECRKLQDRKIRDECKKSEDRKKLEECRKLDEDRKQDETEIDECKKLEERRKVEEFKRRKKAELCKYIEEKRKLDECKKLEELEKLDECRKLEDLRKHDECRKLEELRKLDECTEVNECRDIDPCLDIDKCLDYDESKEYKECRQFDESRKPNDFQICDGSCLNANDSCLVNEVKYDNFETGRVIADDCNDYNDYQEPMCCRQIVTQESPCPICPCTGCVKQRSIYSNLTSCEMSLTDMQCPSDKLDDTKTARLKVKKELQTKGGKGESKFYSGKPYLEITIDRPGTEICVDMSQCRTHSSAYRPSKIPKPATCSIIQPASGRQSDRQTSPVDKHISLIPQLTKKTADDLELAPCHCSKSAENKLNGSF